MKEITDKSYIKMKMTEIILYNYIKCKHFKLSMQGQIGRMNKTKITYNQQSSERHFLKNWFNIATTLINSIAFNWKECNFFFLSYKILKYTFAYHPWRLWVGLWLGEGNLNPCI